MKHDDCLFYVRDLRATSADIYLADLKCESCQYYDMERNECMCDFDEEDRKLDEKSEEWYVWTGDKWLPF